MRDRSVPTARNFDAAAASRTPSAPDLVETMQMTSGSIQHESAFPWLMNDSGDTVLVAASERCAATMPPCIQEHVRHGQSVRGVWQQQ